MLYEDETGLSLAPSQAEAIRLALKSKVTVITGGPGVGKTTIVNAILRILAANLDFEFVIRPAWWVLLAGLIVAASAPVLARLRPAPARRR